jgi:predicted acylesterase/phospholipase RssA
MSTIDTNPLRQSVMRDFSSPVTPFALAGGASLGAMQAGMLRALYERGITADLLVGTSAGALMLPLQEPIAV